MISADEQRSLGERIAAALPPGPFYRIKDNGNAGNPVGWARFQECWDAATAAAAAKMGERGTFDISDAEWAKINSQNVPKWAAAMSRMWLHP